MKEHNQTLTLNVTDSNFEQEVMEATKLVLVDFWAEWCAPCKMVTPIIENLANDYGERLKVTKLNVDENPDIMTRYQVRSIPTLMLFQDGELKEKSVGVQSKAQLAELIDRHVA